MSSARGLVERSCLAVAAWAAPSSGLCCKCAAWNGAALLSMASRALPPVAMAAMCKTWQLPYVTRVSCSRRLSGPALTAIRSKDLNLWVDVAC